MSPSRVARGHRLFLLLASVVAIGCHNPASPSVGPVLPADAALVGQAAGTEAGASIECRLDLVATLQPDGATYRGTMGGEVNRFVFAPDGSGVGFIGDAFFPDIRVVVSPHGRASIVAYRDGSPWLPTGESRFWDELLTFEGRYDPATGTLSGDWACLPIDTRGDTSGVAVGRWTLRAR